jgi:hypothetical protein
MDRFFLEGVFGLVEQFVHVHGFHQVIEGPHLHAFDGHLHAGMAGKHDHFGQRVALFDCAEGFDSVHTGHAHIQDHHIDVVCLNPLQVRIHRCRRPAHPHCVVSFA